VIGNNFDTIIEFLLVIFVCRFEALYAKMIPESIVGEKFLEQYKNHNDPVTIIDEKRNYGVKASTIHPIYENFRVKVRTSFDKLIGYK
jgi:L-arabinokinase